MLELNAICYLPRSATTEISDAFISSSEEKKKKKDCDYTLFHHAKSIYSSMHCLQIMRKESRDHVCSLCQL